jgi:hypothetical protein
LAALSNVNPNSYAVCWSDPVALLRYFVIPAYPFRLSGEYLYPLLRVFHVGVNIEGCNAFPLLLLQRYNVKQHKPNKNVIILP